MEYYRIHLQLIQTLPRNTVGTLVKISSFLNQRNTMSDILMFQFVWILTNNLYCYMSQFKHLQCETHQDEKFIHYCQDCHYPLCPECLYPHT